MYDRLGITHESDDSFRAWDKVRTEFLSTIRRLMNLDYENIVLISHEDTSKDITKKSGDKITAIKPNIADKVANKIAGMVDIVASITEIKVKNHESDDEITMYEFTLTEYDKDEYIRIQAEKNASLEEQMTQAQEAMCEIYEMMV